MDLFAKRIYRLPPNVRRLVEDFRDELLTVLGKNLFGIYLFGSIAFPGYNPRAGDIDFYVVVRRPLGETEIKELNHLHRSLAQKFEFGRKLEGFYIPISMARKQTGSRNLVYGDHGRVRRGGSDEAWALHREHFHGSAAIRLYGPSPRKTFPAPDWPSIRDELYHQLVYTRRIIAKDPWWAVLSLCRLIYSFQNGRIVVSKLGAARWALKNLPLKWQRVIRSAIREYKVASNARDRRDLRRDARAFLGFASVQVIAYDTTWDSRRPHIARLRNRDRQTRRLP